MKRDAQYHIDLAAQMANESSTPDSGAFYAIESGALTESVRILCYEIGLLENQLAEAVAAKEAIEKQFAECYAQDQITETNTTELNA